MAKSHSIIPPFPDVDRDAFGNWLSGFTDGEGHFSLRCSKATRDTRASTFQINLRCDDLPILEQIQSYLGCGTIYQVIVKSRDGCNRRPQSQWVVFRNSELMRIVIPHFERYPLRAKKARDFIIWRKGVELLHQIGKRPRRGRPSGTGRLPSWTDLEKREYQSLAVTLRAVRHFDSSETSGLAAPLCADRDQGRLFD